MANSSYPLPDYLNNAKPNPQENRGAWYTNTAPSYAGIFLWIAFYDQLAGGTLAIGGLTAAFVGLIAAGVISFFFYYAPAMWAMQTGYPLYIIGASTFGDKGGYFLPGLFMGALQVGWYSVGTFFATQFILNAIMGPEAAPGPMSPGFIAAGIVWGYIFAYLGVKGIQYVAAISTYFPIVPLCLLSYAVYANFDGIAKFDVANFAGEGVNFNLAALVMIQMVIGFFATAGAAGGDFGMNSRNKSDVVLGGLVGVTFFIVLCGILPALAIAGMMGNNPALANADNAWTFSQAISQLAGGRIMFLLLAIASMAPACFCSFIIANSFSTMIPSISRMTWTMGGATIGIILAVTGAAGNLAPFFGLIGACFGPVCGAMLADYLLSGGKWVGPRKGVSMAGYLAVIIGFIVGIFPNLVGFGILGESFNITPAAVYSFVVGFVLYIVFAKLGLQPAVLAMPNEAEASAE